MKFVSVILAFYIMFLAALPCIDQFHELTSTNHKIIQKTCDNQRTDLDHCSPFCVCDCCVSPVIQQDMTFRFDGFFIVHKRYLLNKVKIIPTVYFSIWQPPQLS